VKIEDQIQLTDLHRQPSNSQEGEKVGATDISKVSVKDFDVSMYYFQGDQLVIIHFNAGNEKEGCVSAI